MNEKVNITKMDGTTVNADIICFIENTTNNKRYVYYTLNEIVGAGANSTVKIYVSALKQNNPALDTPITKEDWDKLKGYMGDALKGNVNAEVKYLPLSELTNPVSVSDNAIAMPTSYDYINKQRGIYASAVATMAPAPGPAPAAPTPEVAPTPVTPAAPVTPPSPEPTPTVAPVEPAPAPEVAPMPAPTEPVVEAPVVDTPVVEPTPAPTPVAPEVTPAPPAPTIETPAPAMSATLTPIDLTTIEQKYEEMIATINKLKEQELEAAKRYNATIELSTMHNEQHANYVQNEQIKEAAPVIPPIPEPAPAPITPEVAPVPEVVPNGNPAPAPGPVPMTGTPAIEPTPVTPIVPEPVANPTEIETNWFDMPANNA